MEKVIAFSFFLFMPPLLRKRPKRHKSVDSTSFSLFDLVRQALKSQNFWVPPQKLQAFPELLAIVIC